MAERLCKFESCPGHWKKVNRWFSANGFFIRISKVMEEGIIRLAGLCLGRCPERVALLPASGSARKYYRIFVGRDSYIGTYHLNAEENDLFVSFSRHFAEKGLHVPEVYGVSEDHLSYIQEDLGDRMLLDAVREARQEGGLNEGQLELYRKALAELVRFQILGNEGLDYAHCRPRPVFDRRCMLWDLNYFKYCFLRLAGVGCSEERLENDFEALTERLCRVEARTFMFRDFQSRNIMVREGEVWFIDYQGGRRGALPYDVASLLYDPAAGIPDGQREELLEFYMAELGRFRPVDSELFREDYYPFVLIRLLQAMGAFGLRGLYERKRHFIDSIRPGLQNIVSLFQPGKLGPAYPEIRRTAEALL